MSEKCTLITDLEHINMSNYYQTFGPADWIGDWQKMVMTYDRVLTLRNDSNCVDKIPEVFTKTT